MVTRVAESKTESKDLEHLAEAVERLAEAKSNARAATADRNRALTRLADRGYPLRRLGALTALSHGGVAYVVSRHREK